MTDQAQTGPDSEPDSTPDGDGVAAPDEALPAWWDIFNGDHSGHRHHLAYHARLRKQLTAAAPWVDAAARTGWSDTVVDPGVDCEAGTRSDAIDLITTIDAPPLGEQRAAVRIVTGRPATITDMHILIGGGQIHRTGVYLLVADQLEPALAAHHGSNPFTGLIISKPAELNLEPAS